MNVELALVELLKIILPLGIAVALVMVVLRGELRKHAQREEIRIKAEVFARFMPLKIAAYERAMLYLERMHPASLLRRHDAAKKTAKSLEYEMLAELEEEYEHNAVQQLYMSEGAWAAVLAAKVEVTRLLREAGQQVGPGGTGADLVDRIRQAIAEKRPEAHPQAQAVLRRDAAKMYNRI